MVYALRRETIAVKGNRAVTYSFVGPDPLEDQLISVLQRLANGEPPSRIEVAQVDVKEEPGRRGKHGLVLAGTSENGGAASYLAEEMACMANTPGGGAIIVGVADDGARIGTELDPEWLRHRIWELTEQRLTVTVREVDLEGTRLVVLTTHEAIEPIRYTGKLKWRVDDNCVEIDATTWHAGKIQRGGVDWSAQPSGHVLDEVSPIAIEVARRYLVAAGDEAAVDLAGATTEDLVRRLNLVTGEGRLTNAGALLLVGTPGDGIDYIRRDVAGGDSTNHIRTNRPLLEQISDVEKAAAASNRVIHLPEGFAIGQVRAIPERALREAVVNGVVHRDWLSPLPTTVEHVGEALVVTSPGGFIGGINRSNIITHPAVPRYRSLAEAMASLRLAEREGIGIDRMVRDMLAVGHPEPEITETAGPSIRVGLIGGNPDASMVDLIASLSPATAVNDIDALLVIDHLTKRGWVDAETAAPVLQRPPAETTAALARIATVHVGDDPLVVPIKGVPPSAPTALRLSDNTQARLANKLSHLRDPAGRNAMILDWARHRGRVSSTEVADLAAISAVTAGTVLLPTLEREGHLAAGRAQRTGRGFFYVPHQNDNRSNHG